MGSYLILHLFRKLALVQLRIKTTLGEQFVMRALLDNITILHHKDKIGVTNRAQAYPSPVG